MIISFGGFGKSSIGLPCGGCPSWRPCGLFHQKEVGGSLRIGGDQCLNCEKINAFSLTFDIS